MPRAERPASSAAPRQSQWQELFWDEPVRTSAPRMQAAAVQQAELFGWLQPEAQAKAKAPAARAPAASSRAEQLARPAPVAVRKVRMARSRGYAERSRAMNREAIARLLQVTEGVNGLKGAPVVQLPRGRFSAQVDLWKGRPVGNPFVMGS